ncbi:MAG: glycosyltransferase family 4 protein, partial [Candidatus Falkowbacteria bacterium]|nr:glycosyltransferase family 4 protein [Candidatus Falkowbacteria bacterium]
MKVLLFTLEYPPHYGGVANYYYNLIKFWPEQNDIFVLNNNRSELINSNLFFLKWLPSFKACYLSIKKNRIEHIIVGHILPLRIVAYLFNLFFNIGYSIVLHGMDFPFALKVKRKKFLTRLILSRADNIICVNSYVSKIAKEFLGSDQKIRIINPGINVKENYALKDKEKKVLVDQYNLKDKYILLSVGRLVKRKGFDYVIKTLKEVIKEIPNLIYVIIGKGEDENNLKQLITSDLENKVILLNNVNDNEKRIWYNICNCFIMPARNIDGDFEGF